MRQYVPENTIKTKGKNVFLMCLFRLQGFEKVVIILLSYHKTY